MEITGYLHAGYPASLGEFGRPVPLPGSGGWLLERVVQGTAYHDAVGPYPLFCCLRWSELGKDLAGLTDRLVSVVLVTDPFGPSDPEVIAGAFNQGLVRYKDHYVIDLEVPLSSSACSHHRRNARRALCRLTVEELTDPVLYLDTWCELYAELIARHRITGISCFSRRAFALQFTVPGLVAFRAVDNEGDTVGMVLWYCQGPVGYYHLAAYTPLGYREKASYALFWTAAERFRGRLRWLSLGAGADEPGNASDGLTRFKKGWSPLCRPVYLGRHVACPERYHELCRGRADTGFFPAYRSAVVTAA